MSKPQKMETSFDFDFDFDGREGFKEVERELAKLEKLKHEENKDSPTPDWIIKGMIRMFYQYSNPLLQTRNNKEVIQFVNQKLRRSRTIHLISGSQLLQNSELSNLSVLKKMLEYYHGDQERIHQLFIDKKSNYTLDLQKYASILFEIPDPIKFPFQNVFEFIFYCTFNGKRILSVFCSHEDFIENAFLTSKERIYQQFEKKQRIGGVMKFEIYLIIKLQKLHPNNTKNTSITIKRNEGVLWLKSKGGIERHTFWELRQGRTITFNLSGEWVYYGIQFHKMSFNQKFVEHKKIAKRTVIALGNKPSHHRRRCINCEKIGLRIFTCKKCHNGRYCSMDCLKQGWNIHKKMYH